MTVADTPAQDRKRPRLRRRLLKVVIGVVALILLLILVVQIVLWSSFPRSLVISQVQQQLGLEVEASDVSPGWFGTTVLEDVAITLPLADDAILAVPTLEVHHAWLAAIPFTRSIDIEALILEQPHVTITQNNQGRWNVQELAEILARVAGKRPAQQGRTTRVPAVRLNDGTILLRDQAGRSVTLNQVDFAGEPEGSLVWRYQADVPDHLHAEGNLLPGNPWQHQVTFTATNLGPLIEPWLEDVTHSIGVSGSWKGQVQDGVVSGRLVLDEATALGYGAQGEIAAAIGGSTAHITPTDLLVTTPQPLLPSVKLVSGTLARDGDAVSAEALQLQLLDGRALVSGRWSWTENAAQINAVWDELRLGGNIVQSGRLEGELATPFPGGPRLTATLASNGRVGTVGTWATELSLNAGGSSWNDMNFAAQATQACWTGQPYDIALADITAQGRVQDRLIELTQVRSAGAGQVEGSGRINLADQTWRVRIDADRVPLNNEHTAALALAGQGTFDTFDLNNLALRIGDIQITAEGSYHRTPQAATTRPAPLNLTVHITQTGESTPGAEDPVTGQFRADATLSGTLQPVELTINGGLIGRNLSIMNRPVGDVAVDLAGRITDETARITSQELLFFGGLWSFGLDWDRAQRNIRINVGVNDLPLPEATSAMGMTQVGGLLQGRWTFVVPDYQFDRVTGGGEFFVANLAAGPVRADRVSGNLVVEQDQLALRDVTMVNGAGEATAALSLPLANPRQLTVTLVADDWPVQLGPDASLRIDAETRDLALDLQRRFSATGTLAAELNLVSGEQVLGDVDLALAFERRVVRLDQLQGAVLGGQVEGSGAIDLEIPVEAVAQMQWSGIDASQLAAIDSVLADLHGVYSGSARIGPTRDERALGPMQIAVVLDTDNGGFRTLDIGGATLTAYVDLDPLFGGRERFQIILSDTPTEQTVLRLADGTIAIWGRAGELPVGGFSGLMTLTLDKLSLEQIVHAIKPDHEEMPGLISGEMRVLGDPRELRELTGGGTLQIAESNLVNLPIVRQMYELMRLLTVPSTPTGEGAAELRLEPNQLIISQAHYFNRGVEIRSPRVAIDHFFDMPQSTLDGVAVGSARPLKDIDLPFLGSADKALSVLQGQITSVAIHGTIDDPKVSAVPFEALGEGFRKLLLGEVQENQ